MRTNKVKLNEVIGWDRIVGLVRSLGKRISAQADREFESRSHRQGNKFITFIQKSLFAKNMREEDTPKFLDQETGEMKLVPPQKLAEMRRKEKGLKKKERARTIRLERNATFADLFEAEEKIAKKVRESGDEDEDDDPTHLVAELWDNFDETIASEVLEMRAKLEVLRLKGRGGYTEEESKLADLRVLEYFEGKGYSADEVEDFLPIKFKKEKKGVAPKRLLLR